VTTSVREERPSDHAAVREILVEAFGQPQEADLVAALRGSAAFIPSLSLVAEADGALVGQILFTRLHVRGAARRPGLALAPMAVRTAFQKRGVGAALVREGLALARAQGEPFCVVLGHAKYYPRFGFERSSKWGIRAPFDVAEEFLMALELQPGGLAGVSGVVEWAPEFGIVT
jgi:putative acetyltransferase